MIKQYPYKFKTKTEFIKEFGNNWRAGKLEYEACFAISMDYLLGTVLEYDFPNDKLSIMIPTRYQLLSYDQTWAINKWMLTSNKSTVPNYKPRKIIREI